MRSRYFEVRTSCGRRADGITFELNADGIAIFGHRYARDHWGPILREHKPALLVLLRAMPALDVLGLIYGEAGALIRRVDDYGFGIAEMLLGSPEHLGFVPQLPGIT